jgi:hypothetical protein
MGYAPPTTAMAVYFEAAMRNISAAATQVTTVLHKLFSSGKSLE